MYKLILSFSIYFSILVLPSTAQNNLWRGFVSYPNGFIEPNEMPCDIIKNGELRIAPALSDQSEYFSNFTYLDTICLSRNFSLEVRMKNSPEIGGLTDFDSQMNFFSNGLKTSVAFAGSASAQANTYIKIGDSTLMSNQPGLVTNLNNWRTVKLSFFDNVFRLYLDGIEIYKSNYTRRICNLDILKFVFKGGGAVDWVKIYDNRNDQIWVENFNDCKSVAPGIICDPFRLDKSVTISRPCANDTLTLTANFPAMSYRWSTPTARIDTNRTVRIVAPPSGSYDLTATVNACFVFFKSFDIAVQNPITVNKTVNLCVGQTLKLSNGSIVNTNGVYIDSLKTKLGCDSIVVINVIFEAPPINKFSVNICTGTYTLPSGKIATTTGFYRDTVKEINGCIKPYEITLTTGSNLSLTVTTRLCEGQNYTLPKGKIVSTAGTYRDTLMSVGGCDSVVITQLSVTPKPKIKIEIDKIGELFEGDIVNIRAVSETGNYSWYENSMPLARNSSDIPIIVKGGETLYKVILNALGCEVTVSI